MSGHIFQAWVIEPGAFKHLQQSFGVEGSILHSTVGHQYHLESILKLGDWALVDIDAL